MNGFQFLPEFKVETLVRTLKRKGFPERNSFWIKNHYPVFVFSRVNTNNKFIGDIVPFYLKILEFHCILLSIKQMKIWVLSIPVTGNHFIK